MESFRELRVRLRQRVPALVDAATYAIVLGGLLTVGGLLVALGVGGDLTTVKYLLFGVGWVLIAIATVRLWPSRRRDPETADGLNGAVQSSGRIQQLAKNAPPARWVRDPEPYEQLSSAAKQFLAGLVSLAISFFLEAGIGA